MPACLEDNSLCLLAEIHKLMTQSHIRTPPRTAYSKRNIQHVFLEVQMSDKPRVFIYGASGYTGKLVAESLAQRGIPFVFAGRNRERLEAGLKIVEERFGGPVAAEIGVAGNTLEELLPLLQDIDVVINVAGPFMQIAWPVVEAALQANCHYLDTTGEQDWTLAIKRWCWKPLAWTAWISFTRSTTACRPRHRPSLFSG
jgi:hypothetical protein